MGSAADVSFFGALRASSIWGTASKVCHWDTLDIERHLVNGEREEEGSELGTYRHECCGEE